MSRSAAGLMLTLGMLGCLAPGGVTCARPVEYALSSADTRHAEEQRLYPQASHENLRSLEMDDFTLKEAPTTTKVSSPTILKLYPSAGRPTLLHANLPLRFGRASSWGAVRMPKSALNLPQRFGRSQVLDAPVPLPCHQCTRSGGVASPSATLPQRFGRTALYTRPGRSREILTRGFVTDLLHRR
ncbi:pro-FMRFamide-related neuropeptide VF [Megalops cyprinoides]|uniref:pro-FMRFamide-related neuropeptide VF n=1 Tax=Megalops cyprinoides TaxID=118141 RepID=UPI001864C157|nr:pro-FMRFamide-related neuropeptide VF [Megalops cyprinoides]